jgi:hypothetical protein
MNSVYLLFQSDRFAKRETLEKFFSKLLKNGYEVEETPSNVYKITLLGGVASLAIIEASFTAASNDFPGLIKALIVPFFKESFTAYLPEVKEGKILYLYEVGRNHPEIYEDGQNLLASFDDESLLTVKTYIETERSPYLSALRLYVHRNTVSYRIERFEEKSGIALENWGNQMYVYELIRAYEKLHGEFAR